MKLLLFSALVVPCLAAVIPHVARSSNFSTTSNTTIQWEDCPEWYHHHVRNHALQCSTIDVPMNHDNTSSGKTFSIPLVRMLAANSSADVPTILFNPGGPGGSGLEWLLYRGEEMNEIFNDSFHLLGFDPRGVGNSTPAARCYTSSEQREEQTGTLPSNVVFEAGDMFVYAENQARACAEIMGEHGEYINTPQTAADMNHILDAIGQQNLHSWGLSYGTILGQTYAQMFPERVGRLVIDGVSDLDDWYNTFYFTEQFVDTDALYARFIEECHKAGENCSLNSIGSQSFETYADLKSYIDDLLINLDGNPIPYYVNASDYGKVTRHTVVSRLVDALKSPRGWPDFATSLGRHLDRNMTWIKKLAELQTHESEDTDDSFTFIIQNDNLKTGSSALVHGIKPIQNYTLSRPGQSSLVSRYLPSGAYERASWSIPTTHTFRPIYAPFLPKFKTANPILVLSTTLDPVCPLRSAKRAHASFEGSGFLEQLSYGHCTVSMKSSCTEKHVKAYFLEAKLPEEGSVCGIDNLYFPGVTQSETEEEAIDEE